MYLLDSQSCNSGFNRLRFIAARSGAFVCALVLLLVFVQTSALNHNHFPDQKGELTKQIDCDICLKIESLSDILDPEDQGLAFYKSRQAILEKPYSSISRIVPTAKSRAPPLV